MLACLLLFLGRALAQNILEVNQSMFLLQQTYAQLILTSISDFADDSTYDSGVVNINYSLAITNSPDSTTLNTSAEYLYDMFVFANPQNSYYLCYMSLISHQMPLVNSCDEFSFECNSCNDSTSEILSKDLLQTLYQPFEIGQPVAEAFYCFVNCSILSILVEDIKIKQFANSAELIVIDNTDYPKNGASGKYPLELNSIFLLEVERVMSVIIFPQSVSEEANVRFSWLLFALFILITLILSVILCNLCLNYRKIRQQQHDLLHDKSRFKEKAG